MVKMPAEVRKTLDKQKPTPIATADASGTPNVVYVSFLKVLDDETLMISDNFFLKTAANLEANPKMAVVCYDSETNKSFQIKGSIEVYKEGEVFDDMLKWVHGVNEKLPAKAAIIMKITDIYEAAGGPGAGEKIA